MKTITLSLALLLTASGALAAATPAPVTTFTAVPAKGTVEFLAIGKPAMLKIAGKGEGPSGSLTLSNGQINGELKFKLDTLGTGISLRDSHLKVDNNPTATLKLMSVAGVTSWPLPSAIKDADFKGTLELNGKTNPISGKATLSPQSESVAVEAAFDILLSQFSVDIPSYAGITVAEKVAVQVKIPTLLAKVETPAEPTRQTPSQTPSKKK